MPLQRRRSGHALERSTRDAFVPPKSYDDDDDYDYDYDYDYDDDDGYDDDYDDGYDDLAQKMRPRGRNR
jgi:hypothetical protein